MWNSDTPAYKEGTDPSTRSIPFYIGWQRGAAYGIFFDNSYRTHFDFGANFAGVRRFLRRRRRDELLLLPRAVHQEDPGRYADLTGHYAHAAHVGAGQSAEPLELLSGFGGRRSRGKYRADDLPLDVLHLDIHLHERLPRLSPGIHSASRIPKAFTDRLRAQGVKVVTIVDPGIKYQPPAEGARDAASQPELAPQDQSYYVYNQGQAQDFFLKRKDGHTYIARVWPGDSVFVDYTLDRAARWWGDLHRAYTDQGVAGIWNDMNEPSDFNDQTGKSQMDVVTDDGGTHSSFAGNRNVFALNEARATYQGLQRLLPNQRPYVITRAAYAGIQRYATMWAGDNRSTWDALALSLPMFMTLGLSGEPFVGSDIGGFVGRTDAELLVRWYQVGFLTPFCRNHAGIDSPDHEPWRYGKYYEDIIRKYLKLRYRLLPFLYTALKESHRTGMPVFRPLLLNYQEDENTLGIDDEFMISSDLLVAPILKPGQTARLVYLPAGVWFDYWTGVRQEGGRMIRVEAPLETVPLFVRGGAILPLGPEMNYVAEKPVDPLRFEIYPDGRGEASTSLYEDDGLTEDYRQGSFRQTNVSYRRTPAVDQIDVGAPTGSYHPAPRNLVFAVHPTSTVRQVLVDGKRRAGSPTVAIADDGRIHRIEIR